MAKSNGNGNGKAYDWEAIEREFKANQLSILEISRQYKCPESTIRSHMKKEGIKRNLAGKVRSRVKEVLLREDRESRTDITDAKEKAKPKTFEEIEAENESIIEEAAERGAAVIKLHRKDVQTSLNVVQLLKEQLVSAAQSRDELETEIIDETEATGPKGGVDIKRRNQLMKAVSLPAHAGVLRDLALAQKHLITLERTAWNLNDRFDPDDEPLDEIPVTFVDPPERPE